MTPQTSTAGAQQPFSQSRNDTPPVEGATGTGTPGRTTFTHAQPGVSDSGPRLEDQLLSYLQHRRMHAFAAVNRATKAVSDALVQLRLAQEELDAERVQMQLLINSFAEVVGPDVAISIIRGFESAPTPRVRNPCRTVSIAQDSGVDSSKNNGNTRSSPRSDTQSRASQIDNLPTCANDIAMVSQRPLHRRSPCPSQPPRKKRLHNEIESPDEYAPSGPVVFDSDTSRSNKRARIDASSPDTPELIQAPSRFSRPAEYPAREDRDVPILDWNEHESHRNDNSLAQPHVRAVHTPDDLDTHPSSYPAPLSPITRPDDDSSTTFVPSPDSNGDERRVSVGIQTIRRFSSRPWTKTASSASSARSYDDREIVRPPSYIDRLIPESEPLTWHPLPQEPTIASTRLSYPPSPAYPLGSYLDDADSSSSSDTSKNPSPSTSLDGPALSDTSSSMDVDDSRMEWSIRLVFSPHPDSMSFPDTHRCLIG